MNASDRQLARSWLNIERMPDGLPGVRDVDAPCADFTPALDIMRIGDCDTDGHYLCGECVHAVVRDEQGEVKP
jgi:hypothetical protein